MPVTIRGSGQIFVQIQQAFKTDTFTTAAGSLVWVDITGLSVNITPTSASNKIMICFSIPGGTQNLSYLRIMRDSTPIAIGDASSNRPRATMGNINDSGDANRIQAFSQMFIDSPATTSTITYKIQVAAETSNTTFINRSRADLDNAVGSRLTSSITVMEISG